VPMMELPQTRFGEDCLGTNHVISFSAERPDLGNWRSALVEPRKNHNLGGTICAKSVPLFYQNYGNRQKINAFSLVDSYNKGSGILVNSMASIDALIHGTSKDQNGAERCPACICAISEVISEVALNHTIGS